MEKDIKAKVRVGRETVICIEITTEELRHLVARLDRGGSLNQTVDLYGSLNKESIIVRFMLPKSPV